MGKFLKDHPRLKYIFFGGKGGVGKTVMAAAAALWSAKQGKKTLLASTNPVHSLSNLLEKDVFGKAAVVCDEEKCYAFEIDTRDTIERSKKEIREKINWFLKFADITTKAEDFIESATKSRLCLKIWWISCSRMNMIFTSSILLPQRMRDAFLECRRSIPSGWRRCSRAERKRNR